MARPCCDPCCPGPAHPTVYARIVGGCACVDGLCIPLPRSETPPCGKWSGMVTSPCGPPVIGNLQCCPVGCMSNFWTWDAGAKLSIFGGTLLDDWTCDPFYQHWTGVSWNGDPSCVGVTFDAIVSEVPC